MCVCVLEREYLCVHMLYVCNGVAEGTFECNIYAGTHTCTYTLGTGHGLYVYVNVYTCMLMQSNRHTHI